MFGLGQKEKKTGTPKLNKFESFAEATAQLKEAGWTNEQINDFIRMSADKVSEEQDNQREYEAELRPEQRAKDTEYYSSRVATTLADGTEWQPEISEYSLTKAEILDNAKDCTETLISVFDRLKEENPLKSTIDIYKDDEAREAITQAIGGVQWGQANAILHKVDELLEERGLLAHSRPALVYFREDSKMSGARFPISIMGDDILRLTTMNQMAEEAADKIEDLYKEMKEKALQNSPDDPKTTFNIYNSPKGKEIIMSAVDGLKGDARGMLVDINKKLTDRGIEAKTWSSISYFTEKSNDSGIKFVVGPIKSQNPRK